MMTQVQKAAEISALRKQQEELHSAIETLKAQPCVHETFTRDVVKDMLDEAWRQAVATVRDNLAGEHELSLYISEYGFTFDGYHSVDVLDALDSEVNADCDIDALMEQADEMQNTANKPPQHPEQTQHTTDSESVAQTASNEVTEQA